MAHIVSGGHISICGADWTKPRLLYKAKAGIISAAMSPTRDKLAVGFGDDIRLIKLS